MSDKNVDKAIELGMVAKYLEGVLDGITASTNGLRQAVQELDDGELDAVAGRELLEMAVRSVLRQRFHFEIELENVLKEFDQLSLKNGEGEVLQ